MRQSHRVDGGAVLDRGRALRFRFNGRDYEGYAGDTLASALLANGVRLAGRSIKYHRPRGIVAAGVEEPNILVQVGDGARTIPNLKATEVELYDGLVAASVNVFPSLRFDVGAAMGALSRVLPAGFYYKTFFGSPRIWHHIIEPAIRRAGGWGRAPTEADPDHYDRMHQHCDVLVVGAGPAGLAASRAAVAAGARVILADENPSPGGALLNRRTKVGSVPGPVWVAEQIDALAEAEEFRLLTRTTVTGYYDDNFLVALERCGDDHDASTPARVRQRLWHIRARQVVLATGAHERLLVFRNNDRPGIMLAGAVQSYLNRWGVLAGRRIVLFTNNDRAYEAAIECHDAGADIAAIIDSRPAATGPLPDAARERDIEILAGQVVAETYGRTAVNAVRATGPRSDRRIACDLLAISGGCNPAVHLFSQAQGRLRYDEDLACFRPGSVRNGQQSVGACNATFTITAAVEEGTATGRAAAAACGFESAADAPPPPVTDELDAAPPQPFWYAASEGASKSKHFVDLQNDATFADIELAVREGFESVEHMKRYTLTGFGTDQGKIGNVSGLAILADLVGRSIPEVGTTTYRPPYTPVTFAAMGGRDRGDLFEPARLTAMHDQHVALGAEFEDVGQWKRPWYYARDAEDMQAAVLRECRAVRDSVGILDASTLGKIDIQGPDAAEFLNRVYTNAWNKLAIGRVRYGVMCREDGMVFDDGTTARLDEHRYLMTTTTGNALAVLDHLEEYLQTEWPDLRVRLTSVTEQWSTLSIAGPKSRDLLASVSPAIDLSPDAFPFLGWKTGNVAGIPARIFRISFTGELQYEINVPWHYGPSLWAALMDAGSGMAITPYGTETMHVLRAEKGFIIVGQETDGTQTPDDLGLGWLVSGTRDFIGRRSFDRADTSRGDRRQLVGLKPVDDDCAIPEGAQLVERGTGASAPPVAMIGYVTSSYRSAALDRNFCLALVDAGRSRHGDVVDVALKDTAVAVTICDPVFFDPANEKRDG